MKSSNTTNSSSNVPAPSSMVSPRASSANVTGSPKQIGTTIPSDSGRSSTQKSRYNASSRDPTDSIHSKTSEFPSIKAVPRAKSATKGLPSQTATGVNSKKKRGGNTSTTSDSATHVELPKVASSITYASDRNASFETGEELEILKAILVREGYLQRLTQNSEQGKVSGSSLSETIDLLDLLRIATLEVVESILNWRKKKHSNDPYKWNDMNYLLKMSTDLDFLQKHTGLIQWLGFTLVRNPFIVPVNLDCRLQMGDWQAYLPNGMLPAGATAATIAGNRKGEEHSSVFIQIGGKHRSLESSMGKRVTTAGPATANNIQAALLAEKKRPKNPYETRVLNDEELVPFQKVQTQWMQQQQFQQLQLTEKAVSRPKSRAHRGGDSSNLVIPSQIGELEMSRIREAEALVLMEEELYGRYTHDPQGRIIPEDEALKKTRMLEMSGGTYLNVFALEKEKQLKRAAANAMLLEPFAPAASSSSSNSKSSSMTTTRTITKEQEDQEQEQEDQALSKSFGASVVARVIASSDITSISSSSSSLSGKLHTKKRPGMLGSITKSSPLPKSSFSKLVPPPRRSRGAHLEQVLAQEKEANERFGVLIERLCEEIEQKEMEVAYFESYAELQVSFKDELHDFRSRARHEIQLLRQELVQKRYVFESKRQNILNKEEIMQSFKKQFKSSTEAVRTAQLDARKEQAAAVAASLAFSNAFLFDPTRTRKEQEQIEEENEETKQNLMEKLQFTSQKVQKAINNQMEHEQTAPIIYHVCATSIQRIARGMIVRKKYANMRIEYNVCSKYIQAVVRGFLARRKVAKMYWYKVATINLQRYTRGMLSRLFVRQKKQNLLVFKCTLILQRMVRGYLGRIRMKKIRLLFDARSRMICSIQSITFEDLKELADACHDMVASINNSTSTNKPQWMSSLVLGLVRLVMLFLSEDDASEPDITCIRWKEAAIFLRRSHRLLRLLTRLAAASEGHYLRPSYWGSSLLNAYQADKDFVLETFQQLKKGSRGAVALFHWVETFAVITRFQKVLQPLNLSFEGFFLARHASEKQHEQEADRTEELENKTLEEDLEKRFVPLELVQAYHTRPRPILLILSLDLPLDSKQHLIDRLFNMFPGLFLLLSHEKYGKEYNGMDFTAIQNAISVGYSVIIESDVGLSDPNQRRFIGALSSIQAALQPKPLCILLKSSNRNRNPIVGLSLVPPEVTQIIQEQHPEGDSTDSNGSNDSNNSTSSTSQIPTAASAAVATAIATTMSLADGAVKQSFEAAAELLYLMSDQAMQDEIERLSTEDAPINALVLVMETIVVLLTPTKRYEGPKPNTSAITWRLSKRLLSNPLFFLVKLHQVTYESVTTENLFALDKYLLHGDWPSGKVRHAQSSNVMFLLASWVESIVKGVHLLEDCGGVAPEITRMAPVPGLFGNVVTFSNVYKEEPNDNVAQLSKKYGQAVNTGEDKAFLELSLAVLGDVRVFRKARKLLEDPLAAAYPLSSSNTLLSGTPSTNPSGLCVVNVFHDCQRIYFSAYDPSISRVFTTIVSEQHVNIVLAPNSIESGRNARTPPTTRAEMYERLANLCLLQRKPVPIGLNKSSKMLSTPKMVKSIAKTGAVSELGELELVVRPRTIRLYRKAIKLCGFLATLTMSELSRGRIQVDAFVHNLRGKTLQLIVNLENILERMSAYEVKETSSFRPAELIPKLVLDRLHLFCTSPTSIHGRSALITTGGVSSATRLQELKLAIRKRETSTGRLLLRRAIKSKWFVGTDRSEHLHVRPRVWLFSVYEVHAENCYRIEFYQPHCCGKQQLRISKRDFQDYFVPVLGVNNRASPRTSTSFITADNTPRQPQIQQTIQQQLQKSTLRRSFFLDGEEGQPSFLQKWIHRFFRLELVRDDDAKSQDENEKESLCTKTISTSDSTLTIPEPVKEQEPIEEKEIELEIQQVATRRLLARFPFVLPFLPHPHLNEQIKRKKHFYVQVESLMLPEDIGGLRYHFVTPETCAEQIVQLKDAEIDSCWESQYNWFLASLPWKIEMTKSLVSSCFYYDASKQLVMARLPCGDFYAYLSKKTKEFQEKERLRNLLPPAPVVVPKPVERPSGIISPTTNLLDLELYQTAKIQALKVSTPYIKPCYLYDQEELLLKKSFRSNGILLMVKVFLKAVIVDRFIQANPKDRVKQEDSFEIRFACYHPPTSSSSNVLIKGMKDLREIVGPDKAALIRSKSINEMLQHIIENRMEIQLPAPVASVTEVSNKTKKSTKVSSSSTYKDDHHLGIIFMRDRLYEKQKATPINQVALEDQRSNATKLIDRKEERGIKILTKTRLIYGVRVILTVFDVSPVEEAKLSYQDPEVILRVDGYIGETSAKSSLILQTVDLLLVAGEQRDMLFDKTRRKEFAFSLLDRIGLEEFQRLETTTETRALNHYRLFVTDYYAPPLHKEEEKSSNKIKKDPKKTLLFKSVRLVSSERILVSIYWVEEEDRDKSYVIIEFYEPLSCTQCSLSIEKKNLDLIFGVKDLIQKRRSNSQKYNLESIPMNLLMTHLSSFVRVEKRSRLEDGIVELIASLVLDLQKANEMRQHFLSYGDPSISSTTEPIKMETLERVRSTGVIHFDGIVGNGQYFAVSFGLSTLQQEKRGPSYELVCCAYSPSSYLMNTVAIAGVDLKLKYGWDLSSTQECYAFLQKELMQHLHVEFEEIGSINTSASIHLQIRLE